MRKNDLNDALMDEFADMHSPETYTGVFFDGKSSTRRYANVLIVGRFVSLLGENLSRREAGDTIVLSPPARHGALLMKLSDGAVCELPPTQALFHRLRLAGAKVPDLMLGANVLSSDWRLVMLVLAFLVGVLVAAYTWFIPAAAEFLAPFVPASIKQSITQQTLRELDSRWFEPSKLSAEKQQEITQRFAQLQSDHKQSIASLQLRATRKAQNGKPEIGPNAFALPGALSASLPPGTIVLTDEMVELLKGDIDAVSGVLAHELAHVAYDHGTTGLLKAVALTALGSAIIGDYSSILATAPAILGQLKYGREAEAQADEYSFELLCKHRIDPARMARLFDEMIKKRDDGLGSMVPEFLSSHPGNTSRAKLFRERCPAI